MALIQTSLIWVAYAVCLAILAVVAAFFIFVYQQPGQRGIGVTVVSCLTIISLLATVLLTPVDVALVSATNRSKYGVKKDWATPETVESILRELKIVYYTLYSLDALLCLLVVPFTYFWHEEYDEVDAEEGRQTFASQLWGAFKYTTAFIVMVLALFFVGFFLPIATQAHERHPNLGYLKDLLTENHGERALSFSIGVLIAIGTAVFALYGGPGLALLPLSLIKSAPPISAPQLAATTSSQLDQNRERQRQLEGRNEGREGGLDSRDRRELEALVREERTLVRRERLAAESTGDGRNWFIRAALKLEAVFRPLKLVGGLLLVVISLIIFASMLVTCIDKIKNSVCKSQCGYILGEAQIFQPVNWLLKLTSKVFPIDYIIFLLLALLFFFSGVVGLGTVGLRFLWVTFFKIRRGRTLPNAMLLATALLTFMSFALNYTLTMIVAPQYATWGPQTFCDLPSNDNRHFPDCRNHTSAVKPCSERAENLHAQLVCTPSFVSTFLNRIAIGFPILGGIHFWAQFAFLGLFAIVFAVMLFRVPKFDESQLDDDLLEEEEEGLLASTGRRFGATWQDITGRPRGVKRPEYGAVSGAGNSAEHAEN